MEEKRCTLINRNENDAKNKEKEGLRVSEQIIQTFRCHNKTYQSDIQDKLWQEAVTHWQTLCTTSTHHAQVYIHTDIWPSTLTVIHSAQLELSVHPALLRCLLEIFQCQLIILKTKTYNFQTSALVSTGATLITLHTKLLYWHLNVTLFLFLVPKTVAARLATQSKQIKMGLRGCTLI